MYVQADRIKGISLTLIRSRSTFVNKIWVDFNFAIFWRIYDAITRVLRDKSSNPEREVGGVDREGHCFL